MVGGGGERDLDLTVILDVDLVFAFDLDFGAFFARILDLVEVILARRSNVHNRTHPLYIALHRPHQYRPGKKTRPP